MNTAANTLQSSVAYSHFPLFPLLPPEIRLWIWQDSCLPRVLEIHAPQFHYADRGNVDLSTHHQPPAFQSRSYNPALLSVSTEARTTALSIYTVALPLASEKKNRDLVPDSHRVLYIALDRDSVVLLGLESAQSVTQLVHYFNQGGHGQRSVTESDRGLRSFGVSATHFAHDHGAAMLRIIGGTLFRDLESFSLWISEFEMAKAPPPWWVGGQCRLHEFESGQQFLTGVRFQFWDQDGWLVVGRYVVMKVVDIHFENGW